MKCDCGSCVKRENCKNSFGRLYGGCKNYEERQANGETRVFRVTFNSTYDFELYSATSRQAVLAFLEELGVEEWDIRHIGEVRRVPLGCSVIETGL